MRATLKTIWKPKLWKLVLQFFSLIVGSTFNGYCRRKQSLSKSFVVQSQSLKEREEKILKYVLFFKRDIAF
jgi:hypothetical protein